MELTEEQIAEIWRRRQERFRRWLRPDYTLAPGYPMCRLEEETEETLSAMPPPYEEPSPRKRRPEN